MQYKIALAGNPNTGKTTLFNALTDPISSLATGLALRLKKKGRGP